MYTVSQLSRDSNVSPHVVRYYTRIRLLEPARDPNNGYKLFSSADADRLRFIRQAQQLGYTLEEIRRFLKLRRDGKSPCREARAVLRRRVAENRCKIAELTALQQRMQQALTIWETLPDQDDRRDRWCHLIEAVAVQAELA